MDEISRLISLRKAYFPFSLCLRQRPRKHHFISICLLTLCKFCPINLGQTLERGFTYSTGIAGCLEPPNCLSERGLLPLQPLPNRGIFQRSNLHSSKNKNSEKNKNNATCPLLDEPTSPSAPKPTSENLLWPVNVLLLSTKKNRKPICSTYHTC